MASRLPHSTFRRHCPKLLSAIIGSVLLFGSTACSPDTTGALADLAAASSGRLVQILLKSYFENEIARANPDPNIPIAQQIH